jgi:hypothetical protein
MSVVQKLKRVNCGDKMKNQIYHTTRTVSKLKRNITETDRIDISNTYIHLNIQITYTVGKNDVELYIYWGLVEIIGLYYKKFQDLNINKLYFCKFDGIRRNFNIRSRYNNLFYDLNYIMYEVKAWINKFRMMWTHFMSRKKGVGNANIS